MLLPCVVTYAVDPPTPVGARVSHAAPPSSTSTTLTSAERKALERFTVVPLPRRRARGPARTPGRPQRRLGVGDRHVERGRRVGVLREAGAGDRRRGRAVVGADRARGQVVGAEAGLDGLAGHVTREDERGRDDLRAVGRQRVLQRGRGRAADARRAVAGDAGRQAVVGRQSGPAGGDGRGGRDRDGDLDGLTPHWRSLSCVLCPLVAAGYVGRREPTFSPQFARCQRATSATSAATSPSGVCGSASTSGSAPCSRSASVVAGPIEASRGPRSASLPAAAT